MPKKTAIDQFYNRVPLNRVPSVLIGDSELKSVYHEIMLVVDLPFISDISLFNIYQEVFDVQAATVLSIKKQEVDCNR